MKRRTLVFTALVLVVVMLFAPLSVVAATNADIIAILKEVIDGVVRAGRDAYCAAGVVALCPK